jgi:hypothetical protein
VEAVNFPDTPKFTVKQCGVTILKPSKLINNALNIPQSVLLIIFFGIISPDVFQNTAYFNFKIQRQFNYF